MTSLKRHIARRVLITWLASWTLLVLQPCCEAVASVLPHDHTQSQGIQTDHHADSTDVSSGHKHCDSNFADVNDLSAPVSEKLQINYHQPKPDKINAWHMFLSVPTLTTSARILPAFHHPPPGLHGRLYLQTQRLRI